MQEQNWVAGLWKFSEKISREQLVAVAEEWAKDANYVHLYIRKMSKDQNGIGFEYKLDDNKDRKEAHDEYMFKTSDTLKRQFGNDMVGWDTAAPVIIVK